MYVYNDKVCHFEVVRYRQIYFNSLNNNRYHEILAKPKKHQHQTHSRLNLNKMTHTTGYVFISYVITRVLIDWSKIALFLFLILFPLQWFRCDRNRHCCTVGLQLIKVSIIIPVAIVVITPLAILCNCPSRYHLILSTLQHL